jgi:hypothetical protein
MTKDVHVAPPTDVSAGRTASSRDITIDFIRTLCIVSMTVAHVAFASLAYRVTHAMIWFDGAMGFVLLSGLVVGLVYRRVIERRGLRAAQVKAVRRAGVVYAAHLLLCAVAFIVASVHAGRDEIYAGLGDHPAVWDWVVAALTLQVNPQRAAILSLYVVLMLLTPLAFWALKRGRWVFVVAGVTVLYIAGQLFPSALTLPRVPGVFGEINWALWQALYFVALIAGWYWAKVRDFILRRNVRIVLIVATVLVAVAARLSTRLAGPASTAVAWLFGDGQMGPGTIVVAFLVVATLYAVFAYVSAWAPRLMTELGRVGRRSLDCYVILGIAVLVVPTVWEPGRGSAISMLYAAGMLVIMWAWCWLRDARQNARR